MTIFLLRVKQIKTDGDVNTRVASMTPTGHTVPPSSIPDYRRSRKSQIIERLQPQKKFRLFLIYIFETVFIRIILSVFFRIKDIHFSSLVTFVRPTAD